MCTDKGGYNRFEGHKSTCTTEFGYGADLPRRPRVIKCHEWGGFVPRKAATIDLKAVKLRL